MQDPVVERGIARGADGRGLDADIPHSRRIRHRPRLDPPTTSTSGFFCSFYEDQQGHALPGFATHGELSGHVERPGSPASSFLNRPSQVRVLPGAPGDSSSTQ